MSHMTFQHILYLDILLPTIYLVLNTILAIHLIYSKEDGIWYGILMMLIPWLPALFLIPNEIYYNTATFGEQFSSAKLMKITLNSVFFPVWPIYNYMTSFRSLTISNYLSRLDKINSIKQIMHSSLHMVLTIFLIMRGRLLQEDENSCVKDNLGRSVCFKYIVILSLILSTILIIGKVIKEENYSFIKIPFISCTLVFRTVSFAFILTYIDWWSVISFLIITLEVIILMQLNKKENDAINENMICMKNDRDLSSSKKETNKENILGCVKACLNIVMPLNFDRDILLFIVTNILILINVFVVFCLVKFLKQFNFENNVINNDLFVVIVLCIICYGVFCSLFAIFAVKMWPLCDKYCSLTISVVVLISFPLFVILSNFVFSKNEIYFYTIQSNENLTEIEEFNFQISSFPEGDVSKIILNYNDISWNMENENNSQASKLCFSFDSRHCAHKEFALTIFVDEQHLNKVEKLRYLARQSGNVYISKNRLKISVIKNLLKCSSSTKIYVNNEGENGEDYQCLQFKFLNFDNEIVERTCITLEDNNIVQKLDIKCNVVQNFNEFVFFDGNEILNKEYLTFKSGLKNNLCCKNRTHFVEYIGQCSKTAYYFSQSENFKLKYRTPDCPVFGYRKYALFLKPSKKCIIILSILENCKQSSEALNCDFDQYSCNMIVKK